ncbi:hypothetical protein WN48_04686 [Eufriesea mexicana]|nr:hypothetical protein WN48_04686 [Eufriesea mexicana]
MFTGLTNQVSTWMGKKAEDAGTELPADEKIAATTEGEDVDRKDSPTKGSSKLDMLVGVKSQMTGWFSGGILSRGMTQPAEGEAQAAKTVNGAQAQAQAQVAPSTEGTVEQTKDDDASSATSGADSGPVSLEGSPSEDKEQQAFGGGDGEASHKERVAAASREISRAEGCTDSWGWNSWSPKDEEGKNFALVTWPTPSRGVSVVLAKCCWERGRDRPRSLTDVPEDARGFDDTEVYETTAQSFPTERSRLASRKTSPGCSGSLENNKYPVLLRCSGSRVLAFHENGCKIFWPGYRSKFNAPRMGRNDSGSGNKSNTITVERRETKKGEAGTCARSQPAGSNVESASARLRSSQVGLLNHPADGE